MRRNEKKSAFVAFQQVEDSESGHSEHEYQRKELKKTQTEKKKAKIKKKNIESSVLKDLAMCSVSTKSKKNKRKGKSTNISKVESNHVEEEKMAKLIETPEKHLEIVNSAINNSTNSTQDHTVPWEPAENNGQSMEQSDPQHQNSVDQLPAIYSPTHIRVTRADGQLSRTIAVSDMMDQLHRFQEQNTQLRLVQEQLTSTARQYQEHIQRDAEIINGLQNEVMMFRQLCLSLQSEVTNLRVQNNGSSNQSMQNSHQNGKPSQRVPPPPGMT